MKKGIAILSIISTLLILVISCKDEVVGPEENILSYKNDELGFKISVPDGWELEENIEIGGYEALLLGSKIKYSGTQPKFNVIGQDVGFELDANSLLQASVVNLPNMLNEFKLDSKRVVDIDQFQCAEVVFHHNYNGITLKQRQLLFMCRPSKFIVITFDSAINEYVRNSSDFDKIQESIKKL